MQASAPAARTYKVNSLDRGLDVLRVIRNADGPMRNHDIVTRTGLPKATVSRLVHTLTVMGYLRRIDQGSYVLGQASGRTGRAMLEGLRLERYAPQFRNLVAGYGAHACLEVRVDGTMVPVYQWSAAGSMLLTSGVAPDAAAGDLLTPTCAGFFCEPREPATTAGAQDIHRQLLDSGWCHQWHEATGRLAACTGVRLNSVALCVLALHQPQQARPTAGQLHDIGAGLLRAAHAIATESPAH
ncbi:MAG: helix-turn-helix domain-containing protein [Pseudomonadota bacterium]